MNRPLDSPQAAPSVATIDWMPRLYLPLLLALCVVYAWHPVLPSDDVWAHAAVGRWIVHNRQVPRQALMLWTSNQPWIAHSWLSQVVFYLVLRIAKPAAIVGLTVLLCTLPFALLWRGYTRRGPAAGWMLLLFALGVQCSSQRFIARPELFSALFLALLFSVLIDDGDAVPATLGSHARSPMRLSIALPVIFVLWANFHGEVALGLVLLVVTALVEWFQGRGRRPARCLAVATAACVVAVCINPYGARLWQALRPIQGAVFRDIDEWRPFWQAPAMPLWLVAGQLLLLLAAVGVWLANSCRRWAQLVWLLLLSVAFLSARRYAWMLSLASLAVLAGNAPSIGRWVGDEAAPGAPVPVGEPTAKEPAGDEPVAALRYVHANAWSLAPGTQSASRGSGLAAVLGMVAWIALALRISPLPHSATAGDYPTHLAHWGGEIPAGIRIFNNDDDSSFLHWRWGDKQPLFIDLLNVYSDQVYSAYRDIRAANPRGLKLLEHSPIGMVILTTDRRQQYPPLARYLVNSPQRWVVMYHGPDGAAWMKLAPADRGKG